MASEKQISANRRNAQKSTGPKTERGKRQSSTNALLHGFTARVHVMDNEKQPEYIELFHQHAEAFPPRNAAELEILEQLTHSQWNLRRARMIQKGLLDDSFEWAQEDEADDREIEELDDDERLPGSMDDRTRLLSKAFAFRIKTMVRYTRYEAHFAAQWWRCYKSLLKNHPDPAGPPPKPQPKKSSPTKHEGKLGSFSQSAASATSTAKASPDAVAAVAADAPLRERPGERASDCHTNVIYTHPRALSAKRLSP